MLTIRGGKRRAAVVKNVSHDPPPHVTGREEERHEEVQPRHVERALPPAHPRRGFLHLERNTEYGLRIYSLFYGVQCTGGERREGKGAKAEARRLNAEESPSALVGHGEAVWNPAELIEAQQVGPGGEGNAGKHNCAVLFRNYSGVTPYPSQEKGERWGGSFWVSCGLRGGKEQSWKRRNDVVKYLK
ncbi:hypothetical protein CISG_01160 [Coccidioides immitis RMSCC 3703]|uniref:Uncharacterized protein n=1 Tax=Coccidioides immitis RMSCC 3703 TaxID=454286 RepID=A0A0J8TRQ2_COCIT|nr:hypothetical protein CISG_01160 [Coccidioides immitis RMSCC 3703]